MEHSATSDGNHFRARAGHEDYAENILRFVNKGVSFTFYFLYLLHLGFEAANHYNYTANSLREKIIQCDWLLQQNL